MNTILDWMIRNQDLTSVIFGAIIVAIVLTLTQQKRF